VSRVPRSHTAGSKMTAASQGGRRMVVWRCLAGLRTPRRPRFTIPAWPRIIPPRPGEMCLCIDCPRPSKSPDRRRTPIARPNNPTRKSTAPGGNLAVNLLARYRDYQLEAPRFTAGRKAMFETCSTHSTFARTTLTLAFGKRSLIVCKRGDTEPQTPPRIAREACLW
jgi:hypothetical protein